MAKKDDNKPDIVMIVSDQHNASITGCYGDPLIKTPNIDRLASEGVLFERALSLFQGGFRKRRE